MVWFQATVVAKQENKGENGCRLEGAEKKKHTEEGEEGTQEFGSLRLEERKILLRFKGFSYFSYL